MSRETLETVLNSINKHYGSGTILRASQSSILEVTRIPFGIFSLDSALGGVGGLPRGRITVIKGEFSTGKTALCLKAAAQFQHHCRLCGTPIALPLIGGKWEPIGCKCDKNIPMRVVLLDAERSLDVGWAAKWGINTDDLYVIQTEYAEQGIDVADRCIRSQECDLLLVDSIAALTPGIEVEQSAEQWQMGVAARLMNKACRKWTSGMNSGGLLAKTQCTLLLVNQFRINLGGYGSSTTSPGGKGIDFFQSVEIRLKRANWIEEASTKRKVAVEAEFLVKKNKTAPPMRSGMYTLYFVNQERRGYAIGDTDTDMQILRAAVFWGLVKKGGAWFTLPGKKQKPIQGEKKAAAALRKDPKLLRELQSLVEEQEISWTTHGDKDEKATAKGSEDEDSKKS